MRIAVLGATGLTGRRLVAEALARGHAVVALCREPARLAAAGGLAGGGVAAAAGGHAAGLAGGAAAAAAAGDVAAAAGGDVAATNARLTVARVDVMRPRELAAALADVDALVSGLGNVRGQPAGVLAAGARAVRDAGVARVVWLGALGTGASRAAGGPLLPWLLPLVLGADLADKLAAEELARAGGASVVHAGLLGDGPARGGGRLVAPGELDRRWWPPGIARADVAALMLDEAERPRFAGATAVASTSTSSRRPS
jgi:putative NADH-flavin reductase